MRVIDVDQSTAVAAPTKPPPIPDGIVLGDYIAALVKWYNNERGYGFVTREEAEGISSCTPPCCDGTGWIHWLRARR